MIRLCKSADTHTMHGPSTATMVYNVSTKGAHRLCRVEHIITFEQSGNLRLANGHRTEDQRPVRNRLVTGHMRVTGQRSAGAGGHRNRCAVAGHKGLSHIKLRFI